MTRHCALIMASIALYAAPLSANTPEEPSVVQKENGEFMFKHYPPRALAAGEQGQVGFRVTFDSDGGLTSCDITKSSGFMTLDAETCEFMIRYARLAPRDSRAPGGSTQQGYVNWKLPADAKAAPQTRSAAVEKGDLPEKLICRRDVKTGSLVAREKRCATRKEWEDSARIAKENGREPVGKGWKADGT